MQHVDSVLDEDGEYRSRYSDMKFDFRDQIGNRPWPWVVEEHVTDAADAFDDGDLRKCCRRLHTAILAAGDRLPYLLYRRFMVRARIREDHPGWNEATPREVFEPSPETVSEGMLLAPAPDGKVLRILDAGKHHVKFEVEWGHPGFAAAPEGYRGTTGWDDFPDEMFEVAEGPEGYEPA